MLFDAAGIRRSLDVMPDGESFVNLVRPDTAETNRIDVILDLRPELERLLPGR